MSALSPREEEVVRLIVKGLENGQVSALLCIEEGTVSQHIHRACKKTGLNRASLWKYFFNPNRPEDLTSLI